MALPNLTDKCPMPWGKHKGFQMIDVPTDYLLFVYKQGKLCNRVRRYIETHFTKEELYG